MRFPPQVYDYLQQRFLAEGRPLCIEIDANYCVLNCWGDTSWCGLKDLTVGADLLEQAPYLYELASGVPSTVEYVSTEEGDVVHVHIIPNEKTHFVILLNAQLDHDSVQAQQQSVNMQRLLHSSQQSMIARQRELISELVEAKAELDHHRKNAEHSSVSKGRFIATMSHEFRTPLASIINYAELAGEEDVSTSTLRKSAEAMSRSARHLNALVEAVLDDARLDAGQVELIESEFDILQLLDDLTAMMAPLAAEKGLAFVCQIGESVPRRIFSDEVRFRQILINLLGNAIKYTDEGGIDLTTTYADGRLVSSVADTGPGISVEDQERVFHAFERGSNDSTGKGAGLGLTISLQLAQLMGGEISLDSTLGQGCTVAVNLPISATPEQRDLSPIALTAPPAESFAKKSVSVLVCDDDEDMLALAEYYLHRAGYGLIVATDGHEAIEKALALNPDLILMDCNLPGKSGIESTLELRASNYEKPIIALTASKLTDEQRSCFTHCFRKPAPMQDMLAMIKRLTH